MLFVFHRLFTQYPNKIIKSKQAFPIDDTRRHLLSYTEVGSVYHRGYLCISLTLPPFRSHSEWVNCTTGIDKRISLQPSHTYNISNRCLSTHFKKKDWQLLRITNQIPIFVAIIGYCVSQNMY